MVFYVLHQKPLCSEETVKPDLRPIRYAGKIIWRLGDGEGDKALANGEWV